MSRVEPNRNVYVGHRYVPKIFGEWDKQNEYEGLSIVTHQGASYTSKKRVPVGIDILNEEFWVITGNYNAQVEYYRDDVLKVKNDMNDLEKDVDNKIKSSFINVKFFGAVGDGVTDDTEAFKSMLNSEYNNFFIPKDIFLIKEPIIIERNDINITTDGILIFDINDEACVTVKGNNNIININLDGRKKSRVGIEVTGSENLIKECLVKNIYSLDNSALGINVYQNGLNKVIDCYIENVESFGNDVVGDSIGASRGIRVTGLFINNGHTIIKGNTIKNVTGEEGDSIHLIADHKDTMTVDIIDNNIHTFSRRGIKVQCSGVKIVNNLIENYTDHPSLIRAIDVQGVDNTVIDNNELILEYVPCFGIVGSIDKKCINTIIKNNTINMISSTPSFYTTYADDLICSNNYIVGGSSLLLNRVTNLTFSNNHLDKLLINSDGFPISNLDTVDNVTFKDNLITNTEYHRALRTGATNLKIIGNTFVDGFGAIEVHSTGSGVISFNTIRANRVLSTDNENVKVENNTLV